MCGIYGTTTDNPCDGTCVFFHNKFDVCYVDLYNYEHKESMKLKNSFLYLRARVSLAVSLK